MTFSRNSLLLIICICLLTSCKTNQRENGEKTGRWIYVDQVLDDKIISKGRYKHDFEIGTWREYSNKKLISKKRYRNDICHTTDYHPNGKKRAQGISKVELDRTKLHWYLLGEWKFYDEAGNYIDSKFYSKEKHDTLKR